MVGLDLSIFAKKKTGAWVFATSVALAGAGAAESYACVLTDGPEEMHVAFSLDRTQFSPAHIVGEPPRRAVSQVDLNGRRLIAEAVAIDGGWIGFHTDAPGDVEILMLVAQDGRGSLSIGDVTWRGTCEGVS